MKNSLRQIRQRSSQDVNSFAQQQPLRLRSFPGTCLAKQPQATWSTSLL